MKEWLDKNSPDSKFEYGVYGPEDVYVKEYGFIVRGTCNPDQVGIRWMRLK